MFPYSGATPLALGRPLNGHQHGPLKRTKNSSFKFDSSEGIVCSETKSNLPTSEKELRRELIDQNEVMIPRILRTAYWQTNLTLGL